MIMGDFKEKCYSKQTHMYGVNWYISADAQVDEEDGVEYLDVQLHAEHEFEKM